MSGRLILGRRTKWFFCRRRSGCGGDWMNWKKRENWRMCAGKNGKRRARKTIRNAMTAARDDNIYFIDKCTAIYYATPISLLLKDD